MIAPVTARQFVWLGAAVMMVVPFVSSHQDAACSVPDRQENAPRSWPMFGGSPSRNMVNTVEQKLTLDWSVEEGKRKNFAWSADVGTRTNGSPVVADGRVFIATSHGKLSGPKPKEPKAMMMAFRESDGQPLWQITHEVAEHYRGSLGATPSTPAVVGAHLYYVTSTGEVICADTERGKIQWRYDMVKELKVHMYQEVCHALNACPFWSSPLVIGDLVFTATGNGLDCHVEDEPPKAPAEKPKQLRAFGKLVSPNAPSFIALDKRTGKLIWQSNLPGANIIQGGFSSPTFSDHGGRPQVIFAGGDGVIYSFVPETGKLLWKCDCLPQRKKIDDPQIDHQFVGTPVVVGDKLYVGMGNALESAERSRTGAYFLCVDITKTGDVSLKCYDAKAAANKGSALVWAYGGPIEPRPQKGRRVTFASTASTAAVHDGLVYITEEYGELHCLDAATGSRLWAYDCLSPLSSPYLVDGRVLVGTEDGEIVIFGHNRSARIHARIDMEETIRTTPVAANGRLYVATRYKLYAIGPR